MEIIFERQAMLARTLTGATAVRVSIADRIPNFMARRESYKDIKR